MMDIFKSKGFGWLAMLAAVAVTVVILIMFDSWLAISAVFFAFMAAFSNLVGSYFDKSNPYVCRTLRRASGWCVVLMIIFFGAYLIF